MTGKFIYIDDYNDASVKSIVDGFNDANIISVENRLVEQFRDQILFFENNIDQYDGAIFDLRLDQNMAVDVKYTASSIVQELRTKIAQNDSIKEIPFFYARLMKISN